MAGAIFSPEPDLYPDPSGRADRICRFVRRLKLWEGRFAGNAFALSPFQEAIIRRIYGPCAPDGGRLVRTACIWIPRGNAKTTLASALALAHFMGPEAEAGGQVIQAAADRENAGIAFKHSWEMVKQDTALMARVAPIESRKLLNHPRTASILKAISSEAYSKHGLNVSFFLADEVHAWPPTEARKLYTTVRDSMVKRDHPLTIIISTAGEGMGGLAWDLWDYSHKVGSGEIHDPSFAPIIFAAPPEADWRDETTWFAANPAIEAGFFNLEELRIKARRIEHFPAEVADFGDSISTSGRKEPPNHGLRSSSTTRRKSARARTILQAALAGSALTFRASKILRPSSPYSRPTPLASAAMTCFPCSFFRRPTLLANRNATARTM